MFELSKVRTIPLQDQICERQSGGNYFLASINQTFILGSPSTTNINKADYIALLEFSFIAEKLLRQTENLNKVCDCFNARAL